MPSSSAVSHEKKPQSPQLLLRPKARFSPPSQLDRQTSAQPIEEAFDDDEDIPFIKTTAHGIRCPVVTPAQMQMVEDICMKETGPNREMMIENAGHGASIMALKALGGERRIQPDNHNAAPVVVILAGNNKTGCYSLASARHLANRGCRVYIVLTSRPDAPIHPSVEMQKNYAVYAGVTAVENVEEFSAKALRDDYKTRELLWAAMDWANGNKAPVLSLDFPSGINAIDGHPFHVMHHIHPKWTLCFGAPKQGCTSRSITGELFLADIGIPAVSWREANIRRSCAFFYRTSASVPEWLLK
ncbi:YjeF N-terminal domain-containing protein [Dichotomocladium elegans]|nr:YjeF N-terminal domain-containing protein [Dichotomocladium elegans]